MSKCLCVNPDKEEYLDFGEFEPNNHDGSSACSTVEYFLATEWNGDKVMFVFDGKSKSDIFPEEDNVYDFVISNYAERSILNRTPKYAMVANTTTKEYYFKAALPESEDGPYICPLPFILSEKGCSDLIGVTLSEKEEQNLGRWIGGKIVATNNKEFCKDFTLFESPYVRESLISKSLDGLNIVVTGTITSFSRFEVENVIKEHGGNPQKNVTKKTDILVVGFKPGAKKLSDASKHGTKIIYEKDFLEMLREDE